MTAAYTCDDCGGTFDSQPAYAGHRAQCDPTDADADPQTMSDSEQQQTPTGAPSSNQNATPQKIGQAINEFEGLYPRMTGQCWATVLSTRNEDVTAYRCKLDSLECHGADGDPCPDAAFNAEDAEVCDHLAAAIYQAPRTPDLGVETVNAAVDVLSQAQEAADAAHNTAKVLERGQAARSQQAAAQADSADAQADADDGSIAEPSVAQEAIEEAFDAHDVLYLKGDGTSTDVYEGDDQVLFNVGGDDFDRVKAVTSECDLVGYTGDANAIDVQDVEQYVAEVL